MDKKGKGMSFSWKNGMHEDVCLYMHAKISFLCLLILFVGNLCIYLLFSIQKRKSDKEDNIYKQSLSFIICR